VVRLGFAGDVHFQLNLASLLEYPRGALGPAARLLRAPDLSMVNFESALTADGTLEAKELERPAQRFWYRAPPAALDLLAGAGVDVVTMANNHGADYGADGLADTLRAAARSPVAVVGVGEDRRAAFAPYEVTIHRTDLAVLGADTTPREGSSGVWEAGGRHAGIAAARGHDTGDLLRAVRRAGATAEVVVVYLHWGVDLHACPSPEQVRLAHDLAQAGADVVVGSHAHVLQGAGWLGDTYVAYGLGNFLWSHDHEPETGVLGLRLVDGRVVSDHWAPARIPEIGPPRPLHGRAHAQAVDRWSRLRACAGLAPRPGGEPPTLASPRPSVSRVSPELRERMSSLHDPRCPVRWSQLRYLRLPYVGFDGRDHVGELVVGARYAWDVVGVFARLHDAGWPIRQMRLPSDFGGDDDASMAADNTSAFSCRRVAGSRRWSDHARGAAVDINPVENPYLVGRSVRPPAGRAFADLDRGVRSSVPSGAVRSDDVVVDAFEEIGWEWGGEWSGSPDYQHFTPSRPVR
jgi:poly-gamma-glutamate synthesis protein (capsule biosynthesis protein)